MNLFLNIQSRRPRAAVFVILLAVAARAQEGAATRPPSSAPAAGKLRAVVYYDKNRNGARDDGEPGLPDIEVTNGIEIARSSPDGTVILPMPAGGGAEQVSVISPAAYEASGQWFYNINKNGPDDYNFGLASSGASGDPRKLVHLSGLRLASEKDTKAAAEIAASIAKMANRPVLIAATGLQDVGPPGAVAAFLQKSPLPVAGLNVPATPGRFALERGLFRLVFVKSPDSDSLQFVKAAIHNVPAHVGIVIITETNPTAELKAAVAGRAGGTILLYESPVRSELASSAPANLLEASTGPLLEGAADFSPRAWRIITLHSAAENVPASMTTEVRPLLSHRRVSFLWPQAGAAIPAGPLDVRVSAYDTFQNPVSVTLQIKGSAGEILRIPLSPSGGSLWRARVDLSRFAEGRADAVVNIKDDLEMEWEARNSFGIAKDARVASVNLTFDAASRPALTPPLHALWSTEVATGSRAQMRLEGEVLTIKGMTADGRLAVNRLNARTGDPEKQSPEYTFLNSSYSLDPWINLTIPGKGAARIEIYNQGIRARLLKSVEPAESAAWDRKGKFERWSGRVENGRIYCIYDQKAACLDASTGEVLWHAAKSAGTAEGTPVITENGLVLVPGVNATIHALDIKTGSTRWVWDRAAGPVDARTPGESGGAAICDTPAVAGDYCYFGANDARFYMVDLRSGMTRWWFRAGAPLIESPLIAGNCIFILSGDGHVHALVSN